MITHTSAIMQCTIVIAVLVAVGHAAPIDNPEPIQAPISPAVTEPASVDPPVTNQALAEELQNHEASQVDHDINKQEDKEDKPGIEHEQNSPHELIDSTTLPAVSNKPVSPLQANTVPLAADPLGTTEVPLQEQQKIEVPVVDHNLNQHDAKPVFEYEEKDHSQDLNHVSQLEASTIAPITTEHQEKPEHAKPDEDSDEDSDEDDISLLDALGLWAINFELDLLNELKKENKHGHHGHHHHSHDHSHDHYMPHKDPLPCNCKNPLTAILLNGHDRKY